MARLTRVFGVILVVLGAVYFFLTGSAHPTALIPAAFGFLLFVCGLLANTEDRGRRMLWMHIAVTVGLIGFLFPAIRGGMALARSNYLTQVQRTAAQEEIVMAVVCAVFTALCVRSFIVARVGRTA
ncbi:MAG TPA: hypothetical protein VKV02_05040 [Acidobacteriaceae bacterium]|nr:hypothetical protein [Acidobacteriaceae bacterium]